MSNADRAVKVLNELMVAQSYVVAVLKAPDELRPEDIQLASLYAKDALEELRKWSAEL